MDVVAEIFLCADTVKSLGTFGKRSGQNILI